MVRASLKEVKVKKYKDLKGKIHEIEEGFEHLLPSGSVEITDNEANDLLFPPDVVEAMTREAKKSDIAKEALSRIKAQVSSWNTFERVAEIVGMWNLLNIANATPEQLLARDIYIYVKDKIAWITAAPIGDVQAYDPITDLSWPS